MSPTFSSENLRGKRKNLTWSYEKFPYTNRNVKRAKWQHSNTTKRFDYTAIADRLRRSVVLTTATQRVWLTGLRAKPSHSPQ